MKRKHKSIDERRQAVAAAESDLRTWVGQQVVPFDARQHATYIMKQGELAKLRDALRRAELQEKRRSRAAAGVLEDGAR